jgi:uncharacterized protein YbaR (Trm112 family)
MSQKKYEGKYAGVITLDLCYGCSALWFDGLESLGLSPGSVLELLVEMNDHRAASRHPLGDNLACAHCRKRLVRTANMQRNTRFSYWRCPGEHGHFITFFEFLREKDFVRPLSPAEIEDLKQNVRTVTCSSCGAPVDLNTGAACPFCRAPLSMLDAKQLERVVAALKREEAERDEAERRGLDGTLAVRLMQDRVSVSREFRKMEPGALQLDISAGLSGGWSGGASGRLTGGLVEAGVAALCALLKSDH